jgi:hypothetical protein
MLKSFWMVTGFSRHAIRIAAAMGLLTIATVVGDAMDGPKVETPDGPTHTRACPSHKSFCDGQFR